MNSFSIHLHECEFFAYHGLYDEEQKEGNVFWVSIEVQIDANLFLTSGLLSDSIDYQKIYEIAKARMEIPTKLLEQLAVWIAEDIERKFPIAQLIHIAISKKTPRIGGICKSSEIIYQRSLI